MRINYLVTSISMAPTPTTTATAAVSYASDTVAPAPTTPATTVAATTSTPAPTATPTPAATTATAPAAPGTPAPTASTAPAARVVCCCVGGSVYEYVSPAGYWVVVDTCTRIVLKVEYDLGFGVLGGGWSLGFWGVGCSPPPVCYRGLQASKHYAGCCGGFYGGGSVLSGSWYAYPLPWPL